MMMMIVVGSKEEENNYPKHNAPQPNSNLAVYNSHEYGAMMVHTFIDPLGLLGKGLGHRVRGLVQDGFGLGHGVGVTRSGFGHRSISRLISIMR